MKKYISNREVLIHACFWLLYFSTVNVHWGQDWFDPSIRPRNPAPLSVLVFPLVFYLHTLWLIPAFLKKNRWLPHVVVTVSVFALPEIMRAMLVSWAGSSAAPFSERFLQEVSGRDSLWFGSPSPVWYGILLSFAYRFTKDWVVNVIRAERLQAERTSNELRLLKAQINPHFIFNNLNTLDDLINRDRELAQTYLHQLSHVYRYLLKTSEKDVVTLQEEWDFIQDYIGLLEVRFGGAYQFVRTNELGDLNQYLIPPAALQVLMENVVKHNEGHMDEPLIADLSVGPDGVRVSHNRRPKISQKHSLGTGLANLRARYQLLSHQDIKIENGGNFAVTLPLIKIIT